MTTYVVPYGYDFGSYMTQSGNTDHYNSSCDFRTIMGFPKEKSSVIVEAMKSKVGFIGDDVGWRKGILQLEYPIKRGLIKDWDLFELFLEYSFHCGSRISPEEHPIVISDSTFVPISQRAKMIELMYERFSVPAFAMVNCALASCLNSGRTTATIVTCGEGRSYIQSFYEGYLLKESISKMEIGGWDITEYLQQMLNQKGHTFTTSSNFELVRCIKEKMSFVKLEESDEKIQKEYELPDGSEIMLEDELHECVEPLFSPHLAGVDCLGIHELVSNSIQNCSIDIRMDLFRNIIPAGGNSTITNFVDRLKLELDKLAPPKAKVKVVDDASRKYSVWNGMATLSNMTSFQDQWVIKSYYEEHGPSSLLARCVNFCG